jgi:hypothetical protein
VLAAADLQPALVLVVVRVRLARADRPPRLDQARVEVAEAVGLAVALELGTLERRDRLRIRDLLAGELGEGGELAPPPLAGGDHDLLVDVVGEEQERGALTMLLALEQHRRERRQQRAERAERARLGRQAVAERAVADLVVVLVEHHEPLGRDVVGAGAEAAGAERRIAAVVEVRAAVGLGELADLAELLVVAVAVTGEQHAQRVVEVVGPDRVAAPAAALVRAHHLGVVHAALRDHQRARFERVHARAERLHEVHGAAVEDRVDGVEPQAVDVEVADPALGALQHPLADAAAVAVVVVHGLAPHRLVHAGEVRAERLEGLNAGRADVVVDDVEQYREPLGVGGVDEPLEPLRAAVGGMRGRQVDAVVAPAVAAGELGHRHQLDRRDAELAQAAQVRDHGVERPLGGEGADVELVDHAVGEVGRREAVVGPRERGGIEHPRGAAQPVRLRARRRVGQLDAVDHVDVVLARRHRQHGLADAEAGVRQLVVRAAGAQHDPLRARGPDAELGGVAGGAGTERALEGQCGIGHVEASRAALRCWWPSALPPRRP